MILKLLLLTSFLSFGSLEFSKIDNPGCPENSFCRKETGQLREAWLKKLDQINLPKANISKINQEIKNANGYPVSVWAKEEAQILPHVILWDSPCKNHKNELDRYYVGEFFAQDLNQKNLAHFPSLVFSKAIILTKNREIKVYSTPQGEKPHFISSEGLHFLKEDEGKYYALLISKDGALKVDSVESILKNKSLPQNSDAICSKEQIDELKKYSPNPTFFESYSCKNIWNMNTQSFDNVLTPRSCE